MNSNYLVDLNFPYELPKSISTKNISKLFHYTNDAKKSKIVGKNKVVFRLSRVDNFLDKNEGFQILEPYYHACGDLYESKIINKDFYELLVSIKQNDLIENFFGAWVLCFSKNGNSAFMKRRYAAGNGWILSIPFELLEDACFEFPEELGSVDLYEVQYSFNKLFRIIKTSLKEFYKIYKKEPNKYCNPKRDIIRWLCEYSLIYKSSDYKFEEELRLICKFTPNFSSWKSKANKIQFRSSINGYDATVEMILNKNWLTYKSQDLEPCFETKLNKNMISTVKLKKYLK